MKTTVAEFDNVNDLVSAYAELLAIEKIENGSRLSKQEIKEELKKEYNTFANTEDRPVMDLWVEDSKKCYDDLYQQCAHLFEKEKKEKVKDHYNYKIPLDLYKASKSDFKAGVVEMLANEGNLFIKGASDTGKSHLAVAVLREHVSINPKIKIEMFFEDDFHELTYEESQKEIKRLKKLDGVVFDDLGAIGLGVDKRNLIKGLIYSNFRNNKLCIICSNCVIDDLYDSRTGSKIVGACTIVEKQDTGTRKKNKKVIKI